MKHAFFIILAACTWGIISIYVNVLHAAGFTSMQCVALRTVISLPLLLVFLLVTDRSKLKISRRDLPLFAGTGICSMVFFNFCYFQCMEVMGSAAVPALLLYTAPAMVMMMSSIFFHEKITAKKIAALAVTFLGLGVVTGAFGGGSAISVNAVLLGIGSGFGYALYSIFGKPLSRKYDSLTITFYTFLTAAVVSVPVSGIGKNLKPLSDGRILLWVLAMAVFSTIIPYLAYTIGLSGMEAGKASVLACVEPVAAAVTGVLFFGESLTPNKLFGMACILAAVMMLNVHIPVRIRRRQHRLV